MEGSAIFNRKKEFKGKTLLNYIKDYLISNKIEGLSRNLKFYIEQESFEFYHDKALGEGEGVECFKFNENYEIDHHYNFFEANNLSKKEIFCVKEDPSSVEK